MGASNARRHPLSSAVKIAGDARTATLTAGMRERGHVMREFAFAALRVRSASARPLHTHLYCEI